jgi:NAD(P)-dependent dehydrogenase (short-subunit alcohol dehydrogenase family)
MEPKRKVIVITGGSRGLGRAMMEGFIDAGHTVHGCGRNAKALSEIALKHGAPHSFEVVDVREAAAVEDWAKKVIGRSGPPHFLINNAALVNPSAPLWEQTPEDFQDVVDVNIVGVFHTIRAFAPAMIRRNDGVIVNFSSGWGRSTSPEVAPYCATKWAIEGLTQALAQELPDGMAAVPLNPGIIDTEMLRSCFGDSASSYPKPEEWADLAVPFILKLTSRNNGQPLSVG